VGVGREGETARLWSRPKTSLDSNGLIMSVLPTFWNGVPGAQHAEIADGTPRIPTAVAPQRCFVSTTRNRRRSWISEVQVAHQPRVLTPTAFNIPRTNAPTLPLRSRGVFSAGRCLMAENRSPCCTTGLSLPVLGLKVLMAPNNGGCLGPTGCGYEVWNGVGALVTVGSEGISAGVMTRQKLSA
jgi:hypothetical protein